MTNYNLFLQNTNFFLPKIKEQIKSLLIYIYLFCLFMESRTDSKIAIFTFRSAKCKMSDYNYLTKKEI